MDQYEKEGGPAKDMTVHDVFMGLAVMGLCANTDYSWSVETIITDAHTFASAMIEFKRVKAKENE
jgi:hypothetical protein